MFQLGWTREGGGEGKKKKKMMMMMMTVDLNSGVQETHRLKLATFLIVFWWMQFDI
jgi:hypothetical protein